MTSYVWNVRPKSEELLVDEMLAISAQIQSWRDKKEAEEAQFHYTLWLNSEERE